ncbi:hypothetical protein EJB05_30122, partial [Eragrostis curvula]
MPTRCSRGGLTGLRLRRLISFLRRNGLSATAHTYALRPPFPAAPTAILIRSQPDSVLLINHSLERQTGVFFDAAHLRRMLLDDRCAAASSYALRFVTVGDCSPEAEALNVRILVLRVIADFAAGQAHAVDALFQRLYANLHFYKDSEAIGKLLLSMRSDRTKASILHRRIKPKAVDVIMDLVAKCPELQAKARLPRCTFDPAYIMSLRPPGGLWQYRSHHKNKIGRIPAHVLARSFLRKRPPHISQEEITKFSLKQYHNILVKCVVLSGHLFLLHSIQWGIWRALHRNMKFASLKRTRGTIMVAVVSGTWGRYKWCARMLGGGGRVRKEEKDSNKSKKCKMSAMSETDASLSCMSSG